GNGIPIRSMANPNSYGFQPDTYNGTHWVNTTGCSPTSANDECGVHTNSGVQNFMYYMLVNGKSGVNDVGDSYAVTGIGMDAARKIAYYTLTHNLTATSTYLDARKAWIQAAESIFGSCSNEAMQTGNSWYAVGVGSQSSSYNFNVCGTLPTNYKVIHTLSVSNGCTASALSGTSASISAGVNIIIYPGFTALSGSTFHAYIDPCDMTVYRSSGSPNSNENQIEQIVSENSELKAYPSPFSDKLTIEFNLRKDDNASIKLFDLMGKEIKTITNSFFPGGKNEVLLDASNLPAGIYFVVFQSSDFRKEQKIIKVN
ncbi:MAG: M4 family metallopeptidase, partial [Bacteroidota bacterium]